MSELKPSLLAEPRLVVPIELYYFDTDAGGVVHNVAYLRLIEIARSKLAEALGWSLGEMNATGLVPVVARTEIDYLKPARLGDTLSIIASLEKMEAIRFFLTFEMVRQNDQATIVKCRQTMVTVQLPGGRPKPIPVAWAEAYPHLLEG